MTIDASPADDRAWRSTSQRNLSGGLIAPHRALHRLSFPPSRLAVVVLLPALFNVLTWAALGPVARAWGALLAFAIERLELGGSVALTPTEFGWLSAPLPHVVVETTAPDTLRWVLALALAAAAWIGARFVSDRIAPLRYFLRSAAFVQITAVAYFLAMPAEFPYNVPRYLDGSFQVAVWLVLVVPWVHSLVYYILDFSPLQKAALTAVTLLFVAVAVPLQLGVHTWLLVRGSLVVMPLLFFLFGTWLLMLPCVSIYGWAMSWRRPARQR
jgi:hypothetical protein